MNRILGIDPGSRVTGYGVIECGANRIKFVDCGAIRMPTGSLPARLGRIYREISEVIGEHRPNIAVVEKVFISVNPQSALLLGHARGSAICACAANELKIFEYSAREIKNTVTGTGSATKEQVQYMVRMLLGLDETPVQDEADALAAAIAHYHHLPQIDSARREFRRQARSQSVSAAT